MSLSQNLQNILDEALNSLLFVDVSFNITNLDQIQPFLLNTLNVPRRERHDTEDSLPELIPNDVQEQAPVQEEPEHVQAPVQAPVQEIEHREDTRRRIRLWSNLLLDYHTQMTNYQNNIRSILTITETMLPTYNHNHTYPLFNAPEMTLNNRFLQLLNNTNSTSGRANTSSDRRENGSSGRSTSNLANLFTGFSDSLTFEPIYINSLTRGLGLPSERNIPTALQISRATTLFTYNPLENTLTSTICPITLEEFVGGESLTRIHACGHIFKTESLFRWFERNRVCPSCRHDITDA